MPCGRRHWLSWQRVRARMLGLASRNSVSGQSNHLEEPLGAWGFRVHLNFSEHMNATLTQQAGPLRNSRLEELLPHRWTPAQG